MPGYPRPPTRTCRAGLGLDLQRRALVQDVRRAGCRPGRRRPSPAQAGSGASPARRETPTTRHGPAQEISGVAEASESQTRTIGGRSNFGGTMIAGSAGWAGGGAGGSAAPAGSARRRRQAASLPRPAARPAQEAGASAGAAQPEIANTRMQNAKCRSAKCRNGSRIGTPTARFCSSCVRPFCTHLHSCTLSQPSSVRSRDTVPASYRGTARTR